MLIEVVSPDTRAKDRETKVEHYHLACVPFYIIVDREKEEGPPRLIGYRYTRTRYVTMVPDDQGRLFLKSLGLRIGVRDNRVVCYDAVTDEELGDYMRVSLALDAETKARKAAEQRERKQAKARKAAEQREQAEAKARRAAEKRAAAAEARLQELEGQLRRLRGETE